jgi:hypothetical protein
MITITQIENQQLGTPVPTTDGAVEASDLGLRPGQWPVVVLADVDDVPHKFTRYATIWWGDEGDQFGGYRYHSTAGNISIFND